MTHIVEARRLKNGRYVVCGPLDCGRQLASIVINGKGVVIDAMGTGLPITGEFDRHDEYLELDAGYVHDDVSDCWSLSAHARQQWLRDQRSLPVVGIPRLNAPAAG